MNPIETLAAELRALPPSCGPVRLVGVDGHAGSGKSTFAARLAAALGGAPVVHLDDLATHDAYFGWPERLRAQVLEPLSAGRDAAYEVYDWRRREFTGTRPVPAAPVVIVEGVGAGRRALRPVLARLLWLEVPPEVSWARGLRRDGPELAGFWADWTRGERRHFAADPSRPFADSLILLGKSGYEVRPGPAGTAGNRFLVTGSEQSETDR
ncbi:hypothetical protein SRB5_19700 [Streptomyces sp. RB5]|uniref:Uridine kinase n=1 Tax=Streptomyces smaragdinus TaxID=2585196 RepID=A0A7K0CEG0_9ACTN|nr:hypothetical protein [Streptomyces smaragdinus]MQY11851.1 hypothetical protein [Streptomyces smaragdinus]